MFDNLFGFFVWKLCLEILFGNFVWKFLFGNFVWKICLEIWLGNFVWKICLEDRPTDRPTDRQTERLLEAPSQSLIRHWCLKGWWKEMQVTQPQLSPELGNNSIKWSWAAFFQLICSDHFANALVYLNLARSHLNQRFCWDYFIQFSTPTISYWIISYFTL